MHVTGAMPLEALKHAPICTLGSLVMQMPETFVPTHSGQGKELLTLSTKSCRSSRSMQPWSMNVTKGRRKTQKWTPLLMVPKPKTDGQTKGCTQAAKMDFL